MSFTEKEWREMKRRAETRRTSEREPYYRGLAQSEVGSKQLTNHPAWNWFLQILTSTKVESERALAAIDAQARISDDFSHEGLSRVQALRRAWHSRIATLEEVIALPSQIIDDAEKAREKLRALNYAESEDNSPGPAAS